MTSAAEAEALIAAHMPRQPVEPVALADASGRILAESILADRDQPPFDRVTMDGIAVASAAFADGQREFRIQAMQAAGAAALALETADSCIRIMTGAMRPEGTDAVIPIERLSIHGSMARVDERALATPGRFIHARGSDRRRGDPLLAPGICIGPAEAAVLASAGKAEVKVARLPRIAIVSTGDELVPVDQPSLAPWQIRSSNDLAIAAALSRQGFGNSTRRMLRDDPEHILAELTTLHDAHDVLILSGGVSMGEFDFVPAALERLGSSLIFHRINQKPGRPMWFGLSGAGKPIFALPGNPVSTLLCMTRYVLPALNLSLGRPAAAPEIACLSAAVDGPNDMSYFVPVILAWDEHGQVLAEPRPTNTSGDFASLAATDGFIELAAGDGRYPAGTPGRVIRW